MTLLSVYSLLIVFFSMLGGWLPTVVALNHTRMQLMMSLVSGLMLGVAMFHLLPHAAMVFGDEHAFDRTMYWAMGGLLLMFVLLRLFHFHQHDLSGADHDHQHPQDDCLAVQVHDHEAAGHDHDHAHSHDHAHASERTAAHPLSWLGIAIGLSIHTLIDGVALGASLLVAQKGAVELAGFGVFLAIALHKPLDAMTITSLMVAGGWSRRISQRVNLLFALMCPLGAMLLVLGVSQAGDMTASITGAALALSAGAFLCISLSDLLPEVQFHSHDRLRLTLALLLGIGLALAIGIVEGGH